MSIRSSILRKTLLVSLTIAAFVAGVSAWWWVLPTEAEKALLREPASKASTFPAALLKLRAPLGTGDEAVSTAVVLAARAALPGMIAMLDLEPEIKRRLVMRLFSTSFKDRIVPFLLNSVYLYEPMGSRVPKTFRESILPKLATMRATPGLSHKLFTAEEKKVEKDAAKGEPSSGLKAKKALVMTVLRMYDALYLQTGVHVGKGIPKLDEGQLHKVGENFESILRALADSQKDNQEISDGIQGILNDSAKKETITITLARFVYEFIERHYANYAAPLAREEALRKWSGKALDSFIEKNDTELFKFLDWEANKKHFAVHITVDGLQGNLLEALTGNNPTFLAKIAADHRERKRFKPALENSLDLPDTQNDYLEWIAADPTRVEDQNYLPFFKKLYRNARTSIARNGVSTTPTISVRNLPIATAGIDVVGTKRGTGVPNFHYIDRKGTDRADHRARAYYFFGNDAILLSDITRRAGMKTMFERVDELGLDSISCSTPYDRGSTLAFDAFLNLAVGEKVRDFGDIACVSELVGRSRTEKELQAARNHVITLMRAYEKISGTGFLATLGRKRLEYSLRDALKKYVHFSQRGLPAYLQIYSPWPDHFAHFEGPFSDAILSPTGELNRLDYWLGIVEKTYASSELSGRTEFGMAGDHGLTPVYSALNPEVEVFERYEKETGTALKILKISSDEGEGPKVNHPEKLAPVKGYDLIIASTAGGNFMVDAFVDQDANWGRQPTYSDLKKLRTLGGKTIDLIDLVTKHLPNSLDYLAVRDSECSLASCKLSLLAQRGEKNVRDRILRNGDRIFYAPEGDLLEVRALTPYRAVGEVERRSHATLLAKCLDQADLKVVDTWCTHEEWTRLTEATPRPDSVGQLSHLYDSDKAGTLNLFPKEGVGYNTKVPGRHAGEHFHEKDAFIGFWGASTGSVRRRERLSTAIIGSVAPTLMEWLKQGSGTAPGEFGFPVIGD